MYLCGGGFEAGGRLDWRGEESERERERERLQAGSVLMR